MDNKSNIKMSFSKLLSEEVVTDCGTYDKMYGCNMDCPILKQGECKFFSILKESEAEND